MMQISLSVRQRPTQFFASARPFFVCLAVSLSFSPHCYANETLHQGKLTAGAAAREREGVRRRPGGRKLRK
jgi:hypothetical protein